MASLTRRNITLMVIVILVAAMAVTGIVIANKNDGKSKSVEQPPTASSTNNDQQNSNSGDAEEDNSVQPDINTQEFRLTAANISCSSSTYNGVEAKNCSGNIRIIPRAQSDMEPGLYKINEQTKLLHDGQEQDLNSLQQLASSGETILRLKLAEGSNDTLAEISY